MATPSDSSPPSNSATTPNLTATYTSPTNAPFTTSTPLPILPPATSQTTEQKTAYLSALRQATARMQEVINKELTARMEEDNRRVAEGKEEGGSGAGRGKLAVDEKKEEENYGEEVVDED